ncbi:hypothetical protein INT45_012597 [Circinella minor]|uniref:Reverse transcriptase domain-containing protein n=1 Tax=Circinella minor TaxID=1195481 RepID=A0A8H7VG53_9FUNG|nr:hypothetical protein INT45_012597 [Circinella minor]
MVRFLDIKSAYDAVDCDVIWGTLTDHLQLVLLKFIKHLFNDVSITVILKNHTSRSIRPRRGVLQGSILSPILYAVFIDSLPKKLRLSTADSILHMEMPNMEISIVVVQLLVIDRLR